MSPRIRPYEFLSEVDILKLSVMKYTVSSTLVFFFLFCSISSSISAQSEYQEVHFELFHKKKGGDKTNVSPSIKPDRWTIVREKEDGSWSEKKANKTYEFRKKNSENSSTVLNRFEKGRWKIEYTGSYGAPYNCKKVFDIESIKGEARSVQVPCKKTRTRIKCKVKLVDEYHSRILPEKTFFTNEVVGRIQIGNDNTEYVDKSKELFTNDKGISMFYVWSNRTSVTLRISGDHYRGKEYQEKEFQVSKLKDGVTWVLKRKKPDAYAKFLFKTPDGLKPFSENIHKQYFEDLHKDWNYYFTVLDPDNLKENKQMSEVVQDTGIYDDIDHTFYFYDLKKNNNYIFSRWIKLYPAKGKQYYLLPSYQNGKRFSISNKPTNLGKIIVDINQNVVRRGHRDEPRQWKSFIGQSEDRKGSPSSVTFQLTTTGIEHVDDPKNVLGSVNKSILLTKKGEDSPFRHIRFKSNQQKKTVSLKSGKYKLLVNAPRFQSIEKQITVQKGKEKKGLRLTLKPVIDVRVMDKQGNKIKRTMIKVYKKNSLRPLHRFEFTGGKGKIQSLSPGTYLFQTTQIGKLKQRQIVGKDVKRVEIPDNSTEITFTMKPYKEVTLLNKLQHEHISKTKLKYALLYLYIMRDGNMIHIQSPFPGKSLNVDSLRLKLPEEKELHIALLLPTDQLLKPKNKRESILKGMMDDKNRTILDLGRINTLKNETFEMNVKENVKSLEALRVMKAKK